VRVGLTGGIASGKSTVSSLLRELGAVVIDADQLARDVVQEFGEEVLTDTGELDRPAVARIVFADDEARKRLEGIVHPLVFEEIVRLEEEAPEGAVVVHDIPLLAESGRAGTFDAVVVVDAPPEAQVARMVEDRGWTREEAESRMAAQSSREDRLAIATYVIDNAGSREELRRQVEEVYEKLVRG
jgi:dephospho-CoA kinase